MRDDPVREIERRVRALARATPEPLVLAVSGGVDSMVLLDAAAHVARSRVAVVATFDHGSGRHAARATEFVCAQAAARELPAVVGRAARGVGSVASSEAAWRRARWSFLREVARRVGGVIVTGHTEDDQIETVVMRVLRGAGARGLAGLYAPAAGVRRPLVDIRRASVERYAAARGVRWIADPTNELRRFFRNRVRHELLPALLRARPALDAELLAIARRAADWRAEVDAVAARLHQPRPAGEGGSSVSVAVADLADYDAESLAVLWPALAARIGLALDRSGTRRLAAFTTSKSRVGASIQLAGGWEVVRARDHFTLRRPWTDEPAGANLPADGTLRWGRWSFSRRRGTGDGDAWRAALPDGVPLRVRAWRPGDRMTGPSGTPRRVKRYFGDAGIIGPDRAGWPVVLAGEEIVWIPGVGRGAAVTRASHHPGLIYSCEHNDR